MYGYDQLLIAGSLALLVCLFGAVYLQKQFLIYTLFAGKKLAYPVHVVLMSFVAVQQLALTVWDIRSHWLFTTSLWPLGDVIFAASLTLVVLALMESGIGVLIGAAAFGRKSRRPGKIWHRYKQPVALGLGGMYIGLALLTGHIVYLIVGGILAIGLTLVNLAIKMLLAKSV